VSSAENETNSESEALDLDLEDAAYQTNINTIQEARTAVIARRELTEEGRRTRTTGTSFPRVAVTSRRVVASFKVSFLLLCCLSHFLGAAHFDTMLAVKRVSDYFPQTHLPT
jgi:hypothetical protein